MEALQNPARGSRGEASRCEYNRCHRLPRHSHTHTLSMSQCLVLSADSLNCEVQLLLLQQPEGSESEATEAVEVQEQVILQETSWSCPQGLLLPLQRRAFPNPCRSCPLQAAGQAKFCRELPESGESPITGVPQQSQKQQLGLRLGRREDKCLPAGEGDPAEGGGAWDAGIRLRGGGPAASSLPTAWPAARSSPAGHCSSQGVLTG